MTHDEIQKAARDRIAEIDALTATLAAERAKLAAMLGMPQPVAPFVAPWTPPPVYIPTPFPVYFEPHYPNLEQAWIEVRPYAVGSTLDAVTISGTGGAEAMPTIVGEPHYPGITSASGSGTIRFIS